MDRVVSTLRLLSSSIVLGWAACSSSLDAGLCEGPDCDPSQELALQEVELDERVHLLSQMDDAIGRIRLISAEIDREPETAWAYCDLLPRGVSRRRCLHTTTRTHLWSEREETTGVAARAGRGPTHSRLRAVDVPFSEWIHTRAKPGAFAGDLDVHGQAWATAMDAVHRGQVGEVGPACAAIKSGPMWRYDCFFSAAQAHVSRWGRANLTDILGLCGAAGPYRGLCVGAVIKGLAQHSPPSGVGDLLSWAPVLMAAHDLRDAATHLGIVDDVLGRFWSEAAAYSINVSAGVSGDLLDALPPAAAPHVRAAIAHRVLSASDSSMTLRIAVDVVAAHLERRLGEASALRVTTVTPEVSDLWPVDRKGEAHLSAVSYLGVSRRTVAADPQTDLKIVVMEAAARQSPPWLELIASGKLDPDQRVRWTAARLEEQLGALALDGQTPSRSPGLGEPTQDL